MPTTPSDDHGPDRIFAPATGQTSVRRNLLLHLLRVANDQGPAPGHGPEQYGRVYTLALLHLVEILDPSMPGVTADSPESVQRRLEQLQGLWTEIVIGEADPVRSEEACTYAHKLLIRFPAATAYYVNECARAFVKIQLAFDLLTQATPFVTNQQEAVMIGRAHAHAVRVLLVQMKLAPEKWAGQPAQNIPVPLPEARPAVQLPRVNQMVVTENHRAALDQLTLMGELFFAQAEADRPLRLRLWGLVVGPTGSGKSFTVKQAAAHLKADYLRVTRGDWIPRGSRSGRPTVWTILDRLLACDRLAVHIDELDKVQVNFGQEWSAALGTDLWNVLDGSFQVGEYLKETKFDGDNPQRTIEEVEQKIHTRLWIVGSGTWQEVFASSAGSNSLGFGRGAEASAVSADAIAKSGMISPELLLRFNSDLVFLNYPKRSEVPSLLQSTGISDLARELGIAVTPDDVDWARGGMRVLETIATRLALEKLRRSKLPPRTLAVTRAA